MDELALHVLDIAQNAITAGASCITIRALEDTQRDTLELTVEDNGRGMSPEMLAGVTSPFVTSRTTRKVGLGIPLLKQTAEMTGGRFEIESRQGEGTRITALYIPSSVDMLPLGDMGATFMLLVQQKPNVRFVYERRKNGGGFTLDTEEAKALLEDVPLDTPEVLEYFSEAIRENERELGGL